MSKLADRVRRLLTPAVIFGLFVVAANWLIFVVLRLAFFAAFQGDNVQVPGSDLSQSLYIGIKFDLRLALLIASPFLVLTAIPFLNPLRRAWAKYLWLGYFVAVETVVLFLYFVDFGHFGYVRMRLNASLLEHLRPFDVAMRMAWETYPVVWGVLGLAVLAAGYVWLLRYFASRALVAPAKKAAPRWQRAVALTVVALLCLFGVYGKWSWYPLRWSDAYFSPHEFASALALNPMLFLYDTYRDQRTPFRREAVQKHYDYVTRLLGTQSPDPKTLSFTRYVTPAEKPASKPNLVVIHLESFAAFKVGVMGNRLNATPYFDAIARQGVLFDNFFIPAVPTARSVFTMLTGIPDYNVGDSASRNPLVVRQHTLVNALADYERFYFIGGSASWGNIRGLLAQSIERLHIYEEGNYDADRADAWGITDHDMFDKVHAVLKDQRQPFFAFVQTAGNHRPYTIPPNNKHGFELANVDPAQLRENGFDQLAAYNGLRFLDHAIGHFFKLAQTEPYFKNTIFILYGDHGNPSVSDIPYERLKLTGFHVPMVIYAPGLIRQPRRIGTVASSVDLLPTALGRMGVAHVNATLGRDLFAPRPASEHLALLPEGILTDEFLLRYEPQHVRLYRYRSSSPTTDLSEQMPEKVAELKRLREALYETARYMLHHNPPLPHKRSP